MLVIRSAFSYIIMLYLWNLECSRSVLGQDPYIPYTSGMPAPVASPILGGVCNLRTGNPCVPEATCRPSVPIVGEAVCSCPKGYGGDGKRPPEGSGCVNIDECASGIDDCDRRSHDCIDLPGTFKCQCKPGYEPAPNKNYCVDIDECKAKNLNKCDQLTTMCYNLEGSYECKCQTESMILDETTGTCRDMNECEDKGGIMNPCAQTCKDLNPGFECGCNDGWELSEDGRTCLDLDECASGNNTCKAFGDGGAQCKNTEGSYECVCSTENGWVANRDNPHVCDNLNECKAHPYICGGPQSCCGDLMPPDKFACMMPVSSAALATMSPPTIPGAIQYTGGSGSSTLGSPIDGFNSGQILRAPVGPAAATIQAIAAASALNAVKTPESVGTMVGSSLLPQRLSQGGCFEDNVEYKEWDLSGSMRQAESAFLCQARCQGNPGCDYFSFSVMNSMCYLKASNFGRAVQSGVVSGPKFCSRISPKQASLDMRLVQPIDGNRVEGFAVLEGFEESSTPTDNEDTEPTLNINLINPGSWLLPGNSPVVSSSLIMGTPGMKLVNSMLGKVLDISESAGEPHHDDSQLVVGMSADDSELTAELDSPLSLNELDSFKNSDDYVVVVAGEKSVSDVYNELKAKLEQKLKPHAVMERRLQVLGNFRRSYGILGGRLPNLNLPLISERGNEQCPPGFNYGQELYRARVRQQAVNTFQTAITGSVNPDGSYTPGLTAESLTNGIVQNTNLIAKRMNTWYGELATIPGELAAAGTQVAQMIDPTPKLDATAAALKTTPGNVAAAAAVGTGLIVGGVAEKVFAGGPGDSLVLDRTGKSKKMAYGII